MFTYSVFSKVHAGHTKTTGTYGAGVEGNHSWGLGGLSAEGLEFLQGVAPKVLRGAKAQKPEGCAPSGRPACWARRSMAKPD